jgi:alpha-tubulin suppressor-like RCC1 family protein
LGPDAPNSVRKPILNPYLSNIVKLSAGNEHSIGLTKNGELYVWGGGGLTGTGDLNKRTVPIKLDFFNNTKVVIAVCGGLHTVAVNKDGEIFSWGSTEGGQLGLSQ